MSLSELEACVLGLIWLEQPCTRYRVQSLLKSSPSPHWSGSAGAVYPLIGRLEVADLIESRPQRQGRRQSLAYRVREAGVEALRGWLGPPIPEWIAELPIDPLRTRVRFLGVLPESARLQFIDQAKQALVNRRQATLEDCARLRREGDTFGFLMARGAMAVSEARIAWLEEMASFLEGGSLPVR